MDSGQGQTVARGMPCCVSCCLWLLQADATAAWEPERHKQPDAVQAHTALRTEDFSFSHMHQCTPECLVGAARSEPCEALALFNAVQYDPRSEACALPPPTPPALGNLDPADYTGDAE